MLSLTRIIPGTKAHCDEHEVIILDIVDAEHVLAQDLESGAIDKLAAVKLTPAGLSAPDSLPDLKAIKSKEWKKALRIYGYIQPLILIGPGKRTRSDVEKVAKLVKKHPATIYRWLNDFESTGVVASLMRQPRHDKGKTRLKPAIENIIQEVLDVYFLKDQRPSPAATWREVEKRCKEKGLKPPDQGTIRNRIFCISEERRVAKRHSYKEAKEKFEPIRGHFPGADWPLAVVQIDHTPMDVIIVDDQYRLPIGRPYLTIATDVHTRMTLGFYISMDPPNALSVGICIANSILSKETFLVTHGIDLPWPCWGIMQTIHVDNAAEFRGTMLGKACTNYGMILEKRPKGSPNYGGHVERQFRTYMDEIHNELPGTTFSNIKDKGDYDSEGKAIMTMDALETWFTKFILGKYHQKPHKGICDMPPIAKWNEGILGSDTQLGTGIPPRVPDEDRLRLDFLPFQMRTVQRYGITFEGISYWSDALRNLVLAKDPKNPKKIRKFICRYDPRNLSKLWLFDEDKDQYIEVPYRDLSRPPISIWELRAAKKRLKEKSLSLTNEELIFKTVDEMREIVKEESEKTKSARKMQQKRKNWAKATKDSHSPTKPDDETILPPQAETEEISDADDILPFDDIQEPE